MCQWVIFDFSFSRVGLCSSLLPAAQGVTPGSGAALGVLPDLWGSMEVVTAPLVGQSWWQSWVPASLGLPGGSGSASCHSRALGKIGAGF